MDVSQTLDETTSVLNIDISCLFTELLVLIFCYLDVRGKGRVAQVCNAWRNAAYERRVWRGVEAKLHIRFTSPQVFASLVRRGVTRVQVLSFRRNLRPLTAGLPGLQSLNLRGCYNVNDAALSNALSGRLSSLTTLNLSLCKQITDVSLYRIADHLCNLQRIDVSGCGNITNQGILCITSNLKSLLSLNLRSCRNITDQGISYVAGIGNLVGCGTRTLEQLCLQDLQKITDVALKYISQGLPMLRSLNLSFCASVTDAGLKFIAQMRSLFELNLCSCDNISDVGIGHLALSEVTSIVSLDVSFCEHIGDRSLDYIGSGNMRLRTLELGSCVITDKGLAELVRTCQGLTALNIGQCSHVTDAGLLTIGENLLNLQSIDLYGCTKITPVGLQQIMQLPKLSMLNLGLWHKGGAAPLFRNTCSRTHYSYFAV